MAKAKFYGVKSSKGDGVFAASDLLIAQSRTKGVKGSVIKSFQDYNSAYQFVYERVPTKELLNTKEMTQKTEEPKKQKFVKEKVVLEKLKQVEEQNAAVKNETSEIVEDLINKDGENASKKNKELQQQENVIEEQKKNRYGIVLTHKKEGLFFSNTYFENYKTYLSEVKNKNVDSIVYDDLADAIKCLELNTEAKKYYVVCGGPNAGVYINKKFYKKNKNLYSKKCKSFENIWEAVGYYKNHMNVSHAKLGSVPKGHCIAYVDGSYQDSERVYSSGIVLLFHDKRVEIQQTFNDPTFLKYRNISGEVNSVILAVNEAILNGVKHLTIRHDLKDLNGEQAGKRKSEIWKIYDRFLDSVKDKIEIEFQKVTAHNKNLLNEFADNLAKNAIEEHMFKGRKTEMYFQK